MTTMRELFSSQIDRRIEKVIDYAAREDDRLLAEISEYEATDNVETCFRKFLENYQMGVQGGQVAEIGVWVSGFYGSGKSSFTKYLGLALDPKTQVAAKPFVERLGERLRSSDVRAMLLTVTKRVPTAVVFLDLGAEQLAESSTTPVSTVLYWKVLQQLGYSKDKKLARLELTLERQGKIEEFRGRYRQRWNEAWDTIHNDPVLGNARAAQVLPAVLPQEFPTAQSFSQLRFEEAATIRDRAQEMIDLLRNKTGRQNIIFLIDEAGQYVAARGELILNLDGLVRDFKELGRGNVWVVATGQQTLAEIVAKATYNSSELNKLQARFPVTIELDARDIKEITYRRLLTKKPAAESQLAAMFKASGQALVTHTKLTGTSLYKSDPDAGTFAQFYPFLPQHFDLLLELIRTLARTTGGMGLRSAIKVIQDVLVDVSRVLPRDATRLADRPVGYLACADDFFDTLRNDIHKTLPHVVAAVDRTAKVMDNPLAVRLAKAIAALQTIEDFPRTAENLAALLYPAIDSPGLLPDVRETLKLMLAEKEIGLIEDAKTGGFAFLSEKVQPLRRKRNDMAVTSGDTNRIRNEIMQRIFDPQPSARIENTKDVKAAVRSGKFLIVGDGEDITFRLEWVEDTQWEARRTQLLTETTTQAEWRHGIAWLARSNNTVEDLLPEIYRSQQIALQVDEHNADRDEAQYLRSELKQAEHSREEVENLLRKALLAGTLIFHGQPLPAAEAGETIDAVSRSVLSRAAQEAFKYYRLAPLRASTDLAARFLSVERLDRMPGDDDPLHLVTRRGGSPQVDVAQAALAETLRAFQVKVEETGSGRLLGNVVQDMFSSPPYGWSKDTVRYLFAALLTAGQVELHTADGTLRVSGPKAAEACKSTVAFNRVGVSLRDAPPDLEALDRATHRLAEIFGDTEVMPTENAISQSVRRHLPGMLEAVGALPDRLRLLSLPGEERALALKTSLTSALSGDATGAVAILGAKHSTLPEDIRWARAALKAFEEKAEDDIRAAHTMRDAVTEINFLLPGEGRTLLPADDDEKLAECLRSDRFYERLADVRTMTHAVRDRAETRYTAERTEVGYEIETIETELEENPDWAFLLEEDRVAIMDKLHAALPVASPGSNPVGMLKVLLWRRSGLAGLQRDLEAEIVRRLPPAPPEIEQATPEVEPVQISSLRPPALLTTESDLDAWLKAVRTRLLPFLRQRKHIRIDQ